MKKEITFYLKDPSRLEKVSTEELEAWAKEAPFYQPLQMLLGIKSEMENKGRRASSTKGIYFTQDVDDLILASGSRDQEDEDDIEEQRKVGTEFPKSTVIIPFESEEVEKIEKKAAIGHNLADDVLEDQVINEVLEDFEEEISNLEKSLEEGVQHLNPIEHSLADDTLEDTVLDEVLENISEEANMADALKPETELDESISDHEVDGDNSTESIEIAQEKSNLARVDLSEFYPHSDVEEDAIEDEISGNFPLDLETRSKKQKKKKSKKKKKKDSSAKAKKTEKDSRSSKLEIVNEEINTSGDKKKKSKKKSKNRKITYLVVDKEESKDTRSEDFSNLSSYANWLLEQESINGKSSNSKKNKTAKKKKGVKKKSEARLKAEASVKKKEKIISEPLADILASQGHIKKAKKMYTRLSLIFPERKDQLLQKIEGLKGE